MRQPWAPPFENPTLDHSPVAPNVGRLAAAEQPGEVLVECEGRGPRPARLLSGLDRDALTRPGNQGREVLVVFDGGNPDRPIVVGLLEDPLEHLVRLEVSEEQAEQPKEFQVDGKRVILEAEEEVVLRCGEGSITLRKDGKIVIRGTHILSRSSGPHRIKGGSVNIN